MNAVLKHSNSKKLRKIHKGKIMQRAERKLLKEIQNLLSATKTKGQMKKQIIRAQTDREKQRILLLEFIEEKGYRGKRAELAKKLARLYPIEGWSERKLNHILTESANIDSTQLNQLLDFLEPDEKIEFSFSSLQEGLDELRKRISDLERLTIECKRSGNIIDEVEFGVIFSHAKLFNQKVEKFIRNTEMLVGHQLA